MSTLPGLSVMYVPGTCALVCAPGAIAFIALPVADERVNRVFELLRRGADLDDALDALAGKGLRAMADFVLAKRVDAGWRLVVRGEFAATVGDTRVGHIIGPWTDRFVVDPGEVRLQDLRQEVALEGHWVPLVCGVVGAAVAESSPAEGEASRRDEAQPEPEPRPSPEPARALESEAEPGSEPARALEPEPGLEPPGSAESEGLEGPAGPESASGSEPARPPESEPEPNLEPARPPESDSAEPPDAIFRAIADAEPEPPPWRPQEPSDPLIPPVLAPPLVPPPAVGQLIESFPWADAPPLTPAVFAPAPVVAPMDLEASELTVDRPDLADHFSPSETIVVAARCPAGHLTPAYAGVCRVCGQAVPTQLPFETPRPPLGVLRLSNGDVVTLDRGIIMGRNPHLPQSWAGGQPSLLRLSDPGKDVSGQHLEVSLDFWHVLVTDLGSTNGTEVILPGQLPVQLRPNDPMMIEPGTRVVLAGTVEFTFEVRE